MGVTLDKYRQGKLWDELRKGNGFASIRETDPSKIPWANDDKRGQEGGRAASTLQNGAFKLPVYWPMPSFYADGPGIDPEDPVSEQNPSVGLVAGNESNGMGWTLFVSAGFELSEHPDRLLKRAFEFFDAHPDVPYVVVAGADGLYFRDLYRPKGSPPLIKDGHYIPSMPDSSALFVLARRERVEAVRPFAVDDADSDRHLLPPEMNRRSLSRRVGVAYLDARSAIQPRSKGSLGRNLTVPEWTALSARLSKSEEFYPKQISPWADRLQHPFGNDVSHAPADFKPTPWFPVPWTRDQLADFDLLPTLGYLHRPVYVALTDEHGHPLKRRDDRIKALSAGWQKALETLPEAERASAPARVVTSTGGSTDKMVALQAAMHARTEAGGPELDPANPAQWVRTDARLGNTGAATFFMQIGIGVLASHLDGGVSAAINLRDDREASIVLISPPPEDKRTKQNAANVFKNETKPLIDPGNYQPP